MRADDKVKISIILLVCIIFGIYYSGINTTQAKADPIKNEQIMSLMQLNYEQNHKLKISTNTLNIIWSPNNASEIYYIPPFRIGSGIR